MDFWEKFWSRTVVVAFALFIGMSIHFNFSRYNRQVLAEERIARSLERIELILENRHESKR